MNPTIPFRWNLDVLKYNIAQNNTIDQVTTNYKPGNHDANHI